MRTYSLNVALKSAARLLWSVLLWCNIPLSVQVREVYFTDNLTDNYLIAMTLYICSITFNGDCFVFSCNVSSWKHLFRNMAIYSYLSIIHRGGFNALPSFNVLASTKKRKFI